ncbi:hypothetical protein T03_2787 [Trichinella britovi]|uniref:Uncharacterized protein n=1 Tax=Trichinella britovi TaxID=45882 RepID=A0A0V0YV51_TRIBR|nr:hypothetical protein T03_2787 [Trichinella britovi]
MFKIQVRINIDGDDNDSKKRDPDISERIANHIDPLIRRRKHYANYQERNGFLRSR